MTAATLPKIRWRPGDYDRDRIGYLGALGSAGPAVQLTDSLVIVFDVDLVRELLIRTDKEFVLNQTTAQAPRSVDQAMHNAYKWSGSRRAGFKTINGRRVDSRATALQATIDGAIGRFVGLPVDLCDASAEILGEAAIQFCVHDASPELRAHLKTYLESIEAVVSVRLARPRWLPWRPMKTAKAGSDAVLAELTAVIHDRRRTASAGEPQDFLEALLIAGTIDDAAIVDVIKTVLVASWTVPGTALAWAMYCLGRWPSWHPRLVREIDTISADPDWAAKLPNGAPVMTAFCREVLRLYPPTWLLHRDVIMDCSLGPWEVSRGQRIMFSPFLLHRDERYWEDPDSFRPERWLASAGPHVNGAYLPFGAGPRSCLGAAIGLRQMIIATALIVTRYQVEFDDLDIVAPDPGTVYKPRHFRGVLHGSGG